MLRDLNGDPRMVALSERIRQTIIFHTQATPMTAEDVIAVLAFMAGSAAGQVAAHSKHTARQLREQAVAHIDHGLDGAVKSPLIIAH